MALLVLLFAHCLTMRSASSICPCDHLFPMSSRATSAVVSICSLFVLLFDHCLTMMLASSVCPVQVIQVPSLHYRIHQVGRIKIHTSCQRCQFIVKSAQFKSSCNPKSSLSHPIHQVDHNDNSRFTCPVSDVDSSSSRSGSSHHAKPSLSHPIPFIKSITDNSRFTRPVRDVPSSSSRPGSSHHTTQAFSPYCQSMLRRNPQQRIFPIKICGDFLRLPSWLVGGCVIFFLEFGWSFLPVGWLRYPLLV
ncbi:expressed unknown protein [Seminavis robusta]|uniref:Uncharacterized protein n=1 Tax=Seminavis robusta TaxID=568900 RepID=A0A9N8HU70_9STRA|nr:expressed unknown protein [Seminavis robusta]|eukprot:Sro1703_g292291.1  (248) ;mRNA; r:10350-11093